MAGAPEDRLDSWKEIAAYLNRGVRTVRRWEHDERLPVHRHVHRTQGSVYAFKSEIDAWRASRRGPVSSPVHAPSSGTAASIAVLPFANLSIDPENEYFADGLTDEVTARLGRVRALLVTSRTSAMTFKHTAKDVKSIAGDLGVRYVLEGSVRRSGDRLRVTAQLIDSTTDGHVWADTYDGTLDDVFAIQERLARMIVDALAVRLTADEDRRLGERPIADVHAYECYLQARVEGWRWRKDAIDRAVQLLRNGLEIVGANARLHAALGVAYLQYREAGIDFGEQPLREAEACAQAAFALDPHSSAALQVRAWIHYARARIGEAAHDLRAALEIEPHNADTLLMLSNCYLISGQVDLARPLIGRALAIDPLTPLTRCMPAFADLLEGRFEAAIDPYRQMFTMDRGNPMAWLFYVWVLLLNRRLDAAAAEPISADVGDTVPARIGRFLIDAALHHDDRAVTFVTPAVEAAAGTTDVFARMLAHGYALAGRPDRALHWLTIAVDRGFINYPFLARHDPFLTELRGTPGFAALLDRVKDQWGRFATASALPEAGAR